MPLHDWTKVNSGLCHPFHVEDFEVPVHQNRVLASYECETVGAYASHIETVGVGEMLPEMPLFIAPGVHVLVPLEGPYLAAWQDTPEAMQRLVAE